MKTYKKYDKILKEASFKVFVKKRRKIPVELSSNIKDQQLRNFFRTLIQEYGNKEKIKLL